ncbi:MAG TPA: hypothetical protein VGK19_21310 [Capsulimonadaceae bacterium]|jgi:hypothetical protein
MIDFLPLFAQALTHFEAECEAGVSVIRGNDYVAIGSHVFVQFAPPESWGDDCAEYISRHDDDTYTATFDAAYEDCPKDFARS